MNTSENYYLPKNNQDYEAIRKIPFNSKSAVHYIKRNNKIKTFYKYVWIVLIAMCACLIYRYMTYKLDDSRFGTIALNIMVIVALQDCSNVWMPRFERKYNDIFVIATIILGIVAFLVGVMTFFISGAYDIIGRCNNILGIVVTMGTLRLKFDKLREN